MSNRERVALTQRRSLLSSAPQPPGGLASPRLRWGPRLRFQYPPTVFSAVHSLVGVHRVQRVPDTEKQGRRHSSTIVVTVGSGGSKDSTIDEADLEETFHRSSGKGGQHQNRATSQVRLRHIPTGIEVVSNGKSQWQNRQTCRAEIERRVAMVRAQEAAETSRAGKNAQSGDSRTFSWCGWRDEVKNHSTGKKMSMKKALKGRLGPLV